MAASSVAAGPASAAPGAGKSELRLVDTPQGQLELRDGATALVSIPLSTPPLRRGPARLQDASVEGHHVAEVRVPVRGQASEEVWIGDLGVRPPRVIWAGLAGPRDADGEASVFPQLTAERIFEYQTSTQVSRCDGQPVRLFPRAWDFATSKFRPILSTPPAPAAQKLLARREDPAMPTGRPRGGFHFVSASTTAAAGADARGLASPTALDDGNPKTTWLEGLGGDGRGEFLTARATAGTYRVRGLRIVPGDASAPAAFKGRNRIKSMFLALGPEPGRQFEIEFPQDPAAGGKYDAPYWIPLPAPVDTGCVTLVIRDVYRGSETAPRAGGGTTAISDLDVFTELDDEAGATRLIADTASGVDCMARVPLLAQVGEPAVLPIAQAILAASGAGRVCLVQALAQIDAAAGSEVALVALASALPGATPVEERLITRVFIKAKHPPTTTLLAALTDSKASEEDRARAARILGELAGPESADALLAAAGSGSPALRLEIAQALGRSPEMSVGKIAGAIQGARGTASASPARVADLLRTLPAIARRSPTEAQAAHQELRKALAGGAAFEIRARTIMAMGALATAELAPSAAADLAQVASKSDDSVLRHLAVRELAALDAPVALETLRRALTDADPRVRETAADGLGTRRDAAAEPLLIAGAKQEDWPLVRRAEIEALGRLCGQPGRNLLVRAVEKDVNEVRRAALVGLTRCKDPRAMSILLQVIKARKLNGSSRELGAALLGELADPRAAKPLGTLVPALVNEAEGDMAVEGVVVASVRALGRLGGPDATTVAVNLTRDARHSYRHVATEALAQICDPGEGAAALAALRAGPDAGLAEAAAAADTHCRGRAFAPSAPTRAPAAAP